MKVRDLRSAVRRDLFVAEYLKDLNATKALLRCGWDASKTASAGSVAWKLLQEPAVQQMLREALNDRIQACQITAEDVIRAYASIAFTNLDQLVDVDGSRVTWRKFEELTPAERATLRAVRVDSEGRVVVEVHDKLAALQALARYFSLFNDSMKLRGSADEPLRVVVDLGITGRLEGEEEE